MARLRPPLLSVCRAGGIVLLAIAASVAPAAGTASPAVAAPPAAPAVTRSVHNDVSPPLRDMADTHSPPGWAATHAPRRGPRPAPPGGGQPSPSGPTAAPATTVNVDGVGNGFTGPQGTFSVNAAPPDTNGAAGPNHYVQIVNTDYAVFNKSGGVVFGPVAINTLWSGFGGLCQTDNDGDPTVRYDRIVDRWIIQQFAVTGANGTTTPFLECFAVSTSGDPTGSFNRFSFSYADFPDYPKLSVWPDAYYLTVNQFNAAGTSFLGANVAALDRAQMLAGQATTRVSFNAPTNVASLLASDLDSATLPPAGEPNFVLSLGAAANTLASFKFHVDFTTPANSTFTGPTTLAVNAFSDACGTSGTCIPQSGTSTQLDSLGDRLMFRLAYRNFGDHESLVASHSVTNGSSVAVRWYELRISGGSPAIFQQGTYAPDATFRFMPSIAMDQSGDIALGFSASSSSLHPGIRYTGRLPGDAAGTMGQGEGTIVTGNGSQNANLTRWGDYSALTVDPADNCTFWYTNQYIPANGSFNWRTRIGSFKFPSCGGAPADDFSIAVTPASQSVTAGAGASYTVSTAVTSGSATSVSLSASGLPSGASASFSPNPITSGGSSTLTVSTAATTPNGTFTLTVTGASSATSHSATASLTVTGGAAIVANGGFETGTFSGWTTSGGFAPAIVTTPTHSGSFAAQLGSTGAVNANSTITQTITVPAGGATLTFWYNPHCTDTVTFDQQQAQIRSTSGSTLATVLNVCNNSGTWTQVTFSLNSFAGQTVVLWFNDHDDGFTNPPDPTWFFLDDVSVS
ncbi:MAG TPA: hypothetical protein VOB72_10725 [Candidatus Dormibacteraeota bacterium]|nr:hypothetical protein [Candidatus Dormibacteraeota bacterium]